MNLSSNVPRKKFDKEAIKYTGFGTEYWRRLPLILAYLFQFVGNEA